MPTCTPTPAGGSGLFGPGIPPTGLFAGGGFSGPLRFLGAGLIIVVCFGLFLGLRKRGSSGNVSTGGPGPGGIGSLGGDGGSPDGFNQVSRLMEEEGIFYFFEHEDGGHTLDTGASDMSGKLSPDEKIVNYQEGDPDKPLETGGINDLNLRPPPKAISDNTGDSNGDGGNP